jgi:uncharacterized protein YndB with AHSA1/START domain
MERSEQGQDQDRQQAQVSITRHYPVAPEKVWRAWTDPQALSQWFGPGKTVAPTEAEIDLRAGGRFRIAFSGSDGEAHEASGVYQEVETNRRLVFSWTWKSTPERVSRISITLAPADGGTELSFVHDRFFDDQARANHQRGWPLFFDSLADFLQEV